MPDTQTHPAPLEDTTDGEVGHDCPNCGGILVDLYGDAPSEDDPIGEMCIRCDFTHYDGDPWPGVDDGE